MSPPHEGTAAPLGSDPGNLPQPEGALQERLAALERAVLDQQAQLQALSNQKHQLETIVNSTPAVIYVKDADGRYLFINRTFSDLFHVSREAIAGRTDAELFPPEAAARFRANDLDVLAARKAIQFAEVAPHDDGPHDYVSVKFPIIDLATGSVAVSGISTDISASKRAERALRESQTLYASLVETLPVAVFRKDLAGRFTFVNERFCHFVDRDEHELIDRTDYDLFSPGMAEKYRSDDERVAREETICDEVEEHAAADGGVRYVHVIKSPVYDAEHHVVGVQGVFWDETERRLAEQALRRTAAELTRSNRELEHFAYVASHDLQEPLRKVRVYGERAMSLPAAASDDATHDCLERMVAAAARMSTLIDDLLALARVQTGGQPFEAVDLNEIVNAVFGDWDVTVEELGAELASDPLPTIEADPAQMRQLFQNLIGNALKYRQTGRRPRIQISCRVNESSDERGGRGEECELRFTDNGIGFDERHRERIFEPFERLHSSDQYSGSGIGLAICRRIVARHGGAIEAFGKSGEGAMFVVRLPVRQDLASPKTACVHGSD